MSQCMHDGRSGPCERLAAPAEFFCRKHMPKAKKPKGAPKIPPRFCKGGCCRDMNELSLEEQGPNGVCEDCADAPVDTSGDCTECGEGVTARFEGMCRPCLKSLNVSLTDEDRHRMGYLS